MQLVGAVGAVTRHARETQTSIMWLLERAEGNRHPRASNGEVLVRTKAMESMLLVATFHGGRMLGRALFRAAKKASRDAQCGSHAKHPSAADVASRRATQT
jgi:hypothetical protein